MACFPTLSASPWIRLSCRLGPRKTAKLDFGVQLLGGEGDKGERNEKQGFREDRQEPGEGRRRQAAEDAVFEVAEIVYISSAVGDRVLGRWVMSVMELQATSNRTKGCVLDGVRLELKVDLRRQELTTQNVIGVLEGSDPRHGRAFVVIGGYLDHVGSHDGKIFCGADDNASGAAAALGVGGAWHSCSSVPRRSGLSLRVILSGRPPCRSRETMINLDMVGSNEGGSSENKDEKPEGNENSLNVVGSKRSSRELDPWIHRVNRYVGLVFEYDEDRVWRRSDHWSFAERGVPVVLFFSGFPS